MSTPHLRNCPKVNCNQKNDCCPFRKIVIPAVMGDDSEDSPSAPENGAYRNALVEYEANGAMYIYASDGIYTKISMVAGGAGAASVNYVDTQDAMTLSRAKAYADSQDAATLQAAKDYTDEHGGQSGEDAIELHINWNDPNIDNIRHDGIIAVWTPAEERDQWSLLLDEDNNTYSPFNLFDDLKSGKRIIIEDFIVGGVYNTQTGTWDKGLATTVEVVARSSEVQDDRMRAIFFYVVAPINPLASELGYTPHDSSNWGPVTTCLIYIEGEGSRTTAQVSVGGFGYYEKS